MSEIEMLEESLLNDDGTLNQFPERSDGLCRYCENLLTGKQKKWCSKECTNNAFDDLMFAKGSSGHIRSAVLVRDNSVCANCGADCERLERISKIIWSALRENISDDLSPEDYRYQQMREGWGGWDSPANIYEKDYMKFTRNLFKKTPLNIDGGSCWQADHIIEVANGGTHTMGNLQTLCLLCHKNKTVKFNTKNIRYRFSQMFNLADIKPDC